MRVKHKNIARFLGYCCSSQVRMYNINGEFIKANEELRFLCFEFLPQGSLDKYISDASQGLDWITRYQIIRGICEGLHYLHQQKIVHLDLQPANILLDRYMVPKIAGFGLSNHFDGKQWQPVTFKVSPSPRYRAPELCHGLISFEVDRYNLGMIIIEILTGRWWYHEMDNVPKSWRERLQETPGCISLEDECHQVKRCIEIALDCIETDPKKRPEIGTVIHWLSETEHMSEKLGMDLPHETRRDAVSLIDKASNFVSDLVDEVSLMDVAAAPSKEQAAMEAPMSSSMGAMGPLLRKLDLLLAPKYPLQRSLKQAIELLKEDLDEVNAALEKQSMVDSPSNKAKYWMDEGRELSYDIEDCIDHMMHRSHDAKVRSIHHFKIARLKINKLPKLLKPSTRMARISEIRALVREASERHERYGLDDCSSNHRFAFTGSSHGRVSALCKTSADLVGVEDSRKEITEWLTNQEEEQLKVLGIIGSAGVGKTTLIRALYRELKGQFECRAFIRMSRKPDMNKIIGEILSQVRGTKQISDDSSVQNSIDSIREHLQYKRYFIVIDDLWDATPWDILIDAFPKGNNCSRIIITAEFQDVAAECSGYHSVTFFEMKPLPSQDSEKLFLHRVFGSEHYCPDQLKEVSSRIIKTSGGLPLAIIMMAGLLASELDNTDLWNQLQKCFFPSLAILTLEQMLEKIVNLCYNSLPQCLKTCLLYLAIFPEGSTIWKVDLLKQWIAEGFITPTEGKERIAVSYFDELVSRGMIQPEKISHSDEVLSFTVHHVVFDLISHKSREVKFVTTVDYSQTITLFPMKVHRLSLQFSCATYASKPEGIKLSQVRSLAFFGLQGCMPSIIKFKHLRVLNLELWGEYDDCTPLNLSGLCRLFQLRYLKVACHMFVELPSQIHGLQFLEILEIDAKVSDIPVDIADLPSLLHLSFSDGTKLADGIGRITSLQTLRYFDLGKNSEDNVRSLGELVNLHDLHLICSEASSDEHLKRNLVAMSSTVGSLANLRSLTLVPGTVGMTVFVDHSYVMSSIPIFLQRLELSPICTFSVLPRGIAKLQRLHTLKCFVRQLLQEDIDILAGLPVLTSLSLSVSQPTSESMVFHSGAFPVLMYFKYRRGAVSLAFQDEALPNLQRLKLGFNVHRGEQYAHMITGIENLVNLKEIALEIGAADGAEESDRTAAEIALKDVIHKHARSRCLLNIKRADRIEDEKMLCLPSPARGVRYNVALMEAMAMIKRWELPQAAHRLVFDSKEDAEQYLAAAACLMGSPDPHTEVALQIAMAQLEKEFRHLLICGARSPTADELAWMSSSIEHDCSSSDRASTGDSFGSGGKKSISDDEISSDLISPETVGTLKDIADIMLRAGYTPELCKAYCEVRRDWLVECLAVLGVDKMSLEEVQCVEWRVLNDKMKKWIQALKVVVRSLLPEECLICSQILAADANPEECFTEVAKASVLHLLNFGDAIATGKRSPEKIFRILDMYEALAVLLPELEALFSGHTRDFINEEAERTLARLRNAVGDTIVEFSHDIQGETSRRLLPGGGIHPMTRYVMNYVRLLANYKASLNSLIVDYKALLNNLIVDYKNAWADDTNMTPLGGCMLKLITQLQRKIEEKSRMYEDEALQNIFLMNNLLYIVYKVEGSELKTMLGDKWIRECRDQVRHSTEYVRASWTRVLACLKDDGLPQIEGSSSALKAAPKDKFKNFNLAFKEVYRTQTSWTVTDPQLREELKIAISEKVLPAYRSFVGRFQGQLEGEGSSAKYMKYNPEDVENMISHLFEGIERFI